MSANNLSPALFFDTVQSFQKTAALKAAVELGVFSAIGTGSTAKDLAKTCKASERGMRVLCDFLAIMGFVTKSGDRYLNTPDSNMFLTKSSPAYLGGTLQFLLSDQMKDAFRDIAGCVRQGGTLLGGDGTVDAEDPVWVDFAQAMLPMMMPAAQEIAQLLSPPANRPFKVLDIAAGHGVFGIMIAKHFPEAQITALDWRPVLEVAKENAKRFEVIDRYKTIPGSAFEADFGGEYDVVLLTNFLHHFDQPTCESLLKKIRQSLAPGGCVITLEFVPNEDRVSPPPSAAFSLVMLCSTPSGDAYTFSELENMFKRSGFSKSKLIEMKLGIQRIVMSEV